eukprot:350622-Chlamydomonas_euryale.AAC.4
MLVSITVANTCTIAVLRADVRRHILPDPSQHHVSQGRRVAGSRPTLPARHLLIRLPCAQRQLPLVRRHTGSVGVSGDAAATQCLSSLSIQCLSSLSIQCLSSLSIHASVHPSFQVLYEFFTAVFHGRAHGLVRPTGDHTSAPRQTHKQAEGGRSRSSDNGLELGNG